MRHSGAFKSVCLKKPQTYQVMLIQGFNTPLLLYSRYLKHIVESCQHFPERQIVTFNFVTKQQHFKNQRTKTSMRQASTSEVSHHFVVKTKIIFLVLP